MFQSSADERRLGQHLGFAAERFKKYTEEKPKYSSWLFYNGKRSSGCHGSWGLSGESCGTQGSWMTAILEWLPSCSGQNLQVVFVTAVPSRAKDAWDSLSASGRREVSLAALRAAASWLHYSCCESPETPQQSPLSQGRHSGYSLCHRAESTAPLQSWARRTPCSEEGNLEVPGSLAPGQPALSKADAAGWIQRWEFSTNPPDSF